MFVTRQEKYYLNGIIFLLARIASYVSRPRATLVPRCPVCSTASAQTRWVLRE